MKSELSSSEATPPQPEPTARNAPGPEPVPGTRDQKNRPVVNLRPHLAKLAGVAVAILIAGFTIFAGHHVEKNLSQTAGIVSALNDSTRAMESAGAVLSHVFGGQVIVNDRGVLKMPEDANELVVLKQDSSLTSTLIRKRCLGCFESNLEVTGYYRTHLGIDLDEVVGEFDPETRTLTLELPRARTLSVETLSVSRTRQDDSWVNRFGAEDAVELIRQNRSACLRLDQGELRRRADRNLRNRLKSASSLAGVKLLLR